MSSSLRNPDPQAVQQAIKACELSHTAIHCTLAMLKQGATLEAKNLIAKQIAYLANALSVL